MQQTMITNKKAKQLMQIPYLHLCYPMILGMVVFTGKNRLPSEKIHYHIESVCVRVCACEKIMYSAIN